MMSNLGLALVAMLVVLQGVAAIKMKVRPGATECMTEMIHSDHFTVHNSHSLSEPDENEGSMDPCRERDLPCLHPIAWRMAADWGSQDRRPSVDLREQPVLHSIHHSAGGWCMRIYLLWGCFA